MANGRTAAPARKTLAGILGTIAAFIIFFGAGRGSWATIALGIALMILAVSLVAINSLRGGVRSWLAGSAHVVSVSEAPTNSAYGRCELQVVVDAAGMPAAAVKVRDSRVPVSKWPVAGATLPIMVAVDDPRRVRIQWDDVLTHAEAAAEEEEFRAYQSAATGMRPQEAEASSYDDTNLLVTDLVDEDTAPPRQAYRPGDGTDLADELLGADTFDLAEDLDLIAAEPAVRTAEAADHAEHRHETPTQRAAGGPGNRPDASGDTHGGRPDASGDTPDNRPDASGDTPDNRPDATGMGSGTDAAAEPVAAWEAATGGQEPSATGQQPDAKQETHPDREGPPDHGLPVFRRPPDTDREPVIITETPDGPVVEGRLVERPSGGGSGSGEGTAAGGAGGGQTGGGIPLPRRKPRPHPQVDPEARATTAAAAAAGAAMAAATALDAVGEQHAPPATTGVRETNAAGPPATDSIVTDSTTTNPTTVDSGTSHPLATDPLATDPLTVYPSARPGPAGAIHGVGITMLVTNLERSIAFYRDMLGFFEIDGGDGNAVLASGDTRLVLRTIPDVAPVNRRVVHLNLEVADVEATYRELKDKGIAFTYAPRPVNKGEVLELWAAAFRDPDGHGIAITQWRSRPPVEANR